MVKSVIYAWTTNVNNMPETTSNNFWGLGDVLRGMISCYAICKQNNYNYIIDIQKHPISNFLKVRSHKYSDYIKYYNKIPFILGNNLNSYIKNNNEEIVVLMTNGSYPLDVNKVDETIKNILSNIFTRNDTFNDYYLTKKNNLKLDENYIIHHYRLGDGAFVRNNLNFNELIKVCNKYIKDEKNRILVLSDNNELKEYIKKQESYNKNNIILNSIDKIAHIGYSKHKDILKDTLVEFFLVTDCKLIKTYSVYPWISGFVLYPSILYDIPLVNLKS